MEEKNKGKWLKIFAIALVVIAVVFVIVTSIILNNKSKEYDDLNNKNQNLPQIAVQVIDKNF